MSTLPLSGTPLSGRDAGIAVALGVCTFVVFAPALGCGFINFDDTYYVTKNRHVTDGLSLEGLRWALTATTPFYWHPLTWLSLQLDASLWWPSPRGFLLTNVLLHAANAALVFTLLMSLTGSRWRSALVALLFALHPLRVESVAWVTERKDVLSCLFGLLTLWGYAAYARRPSAGRYAVVAATFALSLMAKPMLVTLPFLMLVLDWWPLQRWSSRGAARLLAEKLPLLVMVVASVGVTFHAQHVEGPMHGLEGLRLSGRVANATVSYVIYLWKTVWPRDLALFYPHPLLSYNAKVGLPTWKVAGAASLLVSLTIAALALRRRMPQFLAGLLWFLGTLVPVIGLVQSGSQAYADRFTYVPQIGLLLAIVWTLPAFSGGRARVAIVASAMGLALILAVLTQFQLAVWLDPVRLWTHSLEVTGPDPTALMNLGELQMELGNDGGALRCYREALRLDPTDAEVHVNLGNVLSQKGRLDEAAREYEAALRLSPRTDGVICNLGMVEVARGNLPGAAERFREALAIRPDSVQAHSNLGNVYVALGKLDEAAREYGKSVRLAPEAATEHFNLGGVLFRMRKLDEAAAAFGRAIRLDPEFFEAQRALGENDLARGNVGSAIDCFRAALRLRPDSASTWFNLGHAQAQIGELGEAVGCFERASALDPKSAVFLRALEFARQQRKGTISTGLPAGPGGMPIRTEPPGLKAVPNRGHEP